MHGIKSFLKQKLNANDISIAAKKNTRYALALAIKYNAKFNDDMSDALKFLNNAKTQLNLDSIDPFLIDKVKIFQSIYDQRVLVANLVQSVVTQLTSTNSIIEDLRNKVKLLSVSTIGTISDAILNSLTLISEKPSQLNDLVHKINTHVSVCDVIADKLIETKQKLSDITKKLIAAMTKGTRPDLIASLSGEQLDAQTEVDRQQKLMDTNMEYVTGKIEELKLILPFDDSLVPVIDVSSLIPPVVDVVTSASSEVTDTTTSITTEVVDIVVDKVVVDNTALIDTYNFFVETPSSTNEHLPTIKTYASQCVSVLEITNSGNRTLYGFLTGLINNSDPAQKSYYGIYPKIDDIEQISNASTIASQNAIAFDYIQTDEISLDTSKLTNYDITLIDTVNNYANTHTDLLKYSALTNKYIVILSTSGSWEFVDEVVPDYTQFSSVSQDKHGVWPAVMDFIQSNPNWQIDRRDVNNNGLVILKKY